MARLRSTPQGFLLLSAVGALICSRRAIVAATSESLAELSEAELRALSKNQLISLLLAERAPAAAAAAAAGGPGWRAPPAAAFPPGDYNESCTQCSIFGAVLSCHCLRRPDLSLAREVPRGNVTGYWVSAGPKPAPNAAASMGSRTPLFQISGGGPDGLGLLCVGGGPVWPGVCEPLSPPFSTNSWHTGEGTVDATAGKVLLRLAMQVNPFQSPEPVARLWGRPSLAAARRPQSGGPRFVGGTLDANGAAPESRADPRAPCVARRSLRPFVLRHRDIDRLEHEHLRARRPGPAVSARGCGPESRGGRSGHDLMKLDK